MSSCTDRTIDAENNVNTAYFNDPAFNRRMDKQRSFWPVTSGSGHTPRSIMT